MRDDIFSGSNHRYIQYTLTTSSIANTRRAPSGWAVGKLDRPKLETLLKSDAEMDRPSLIHTNDASRTAHRIVEYLTAVSNAVIPMRCGPTHRRSAFWWTDKIAGIKTLWMGVPCDRLFEDYRAARKNLRFAVRKSQETTWRALIDSVESDPWSRVYKIITRKMGGTPSGAEAAGREDQIANELFPSTTPPVWPGIPLWSTSVADPDPFSYDELMAAASRLPSG